MAKKTDKGSQAGSKDIGTALRLSEARFRDLVEGSIQGIIVHRHFVPLFANRAAADIFGFAAPDEILALDTLTRLYAPHERGRLTAYKDARMRGDTAPVSYEYQGLRRDGSLIWLENRVTVVDWEGEPANLTTCFDITERKRAEAALSASDERYRDLVEGSIQGILVSRRFEILLVNKAMAEIFGFAGQAELLELESILPLIAREDRERVTGYTEARLRGDPAPPVYELRAIRKDGTQIWIEVRVSVVNWEGAPASLSTFVDITERKRAERMLRESEKRFRDFAESATDWFWEMDADLRFTYVSGRFAVVTGVSPDTLLGRTRAELLALYGTDRIGKKARESWQAFFGELAAHRPFRDFRPPGRRDGGFANYIAVSGKPVFDEEGRFAGYRGTGTNISAQIRTEQSLRQREAELRLHRDRAEEASRAKSEFLANVSHELRTPLNAIMGFSEVMRQQILGRADPDRYLAYARNIHESASGLYKLISEILDISTVEAGQYRLEYEDIDLQDLVEACFETIETDVYAAGVRLETALDDLPPLRADLPAIQNILMQLLDNAVVFTPSGGSVSVAASVDDKWYTIVVADTGVGIPEGDMPKLTDPFEQGKRNPYRSEERTGLGLAVTLSMVKLHDGRMEMESEVGVGTRVTIRFPRKKE